MGYLTSWTTAEKLLNSINLCDIVEFNRITYSHYGFYIGNGVCIHVQAPDKSYLGSSSTSSTFSSRSKSKNGTKRAERLVDIAGPHFVRVNNSEVTAFQLGVNRRSENEAIKLAIHGLPLDCRGNVILERVINVAYFLLSSNNCEGWSTYWRYNHPSGWSIQAANGFVHSTIGTAERLSDAVLCCAESIIDEDQAPLILRTSAAAVLIPYAAVKISVNCVKNVSDFAMGGVMRILR